MQPYWRVGKVGDGTPGSDSRALWKESPHSELLRPFLAQPYAVIKATWLSMELQVGVR